MVGGDEVGMGSIHSGTSKSGDQHGVSVKSVQPGDEERTLEKTIHVRRVFSYAQFFAFSLAYMGVWEGVCL